MIARVLVLFVVTLLALSNALKEDKPVFVKTLEQLQRGPPEPVRVTRALVQTKWITQKWDNFDENNQNTYDMRYMINDEFQSKDGPIFIYLGGEWGIKPDMISGGIWYDLAREHKGLLVYSEHRFYGKSVPTENMSTENLKYLHVKQALADVAHLIKTLKSENTDLTNSKVVLAGGSYSATMVVWFKRLYPELIVGGFASSAPLLAKVDFREYKEVVGRSFQELGSQQCYDHIQAGIAELEYLFENKRGAEARAMLRLCNDFDEQNDLDLWSLFGAISNIFSGIAQYQSGNDISQYCDILLSWEDPAAAIANFAYWSWGQPSCIYVTYKSTVDYYNRAITDYGASRPWYYQTCNEYGWYQSSGSLQQPFGRKFPATLYTELCADVFGRKYSLSQINSNTAQTNEDFGGMLPEVENIYMTHGGLDPWNPMGHGTAEGATVITNASHCKDFGSISNNDSAEMRASKERLWKLVAEWLA